MPRSDKPIETVVELLKSLDDADSQFYSSLIEGIAEKEWVDCSCDDPRAIAVLKRSLIRQEHPKHRRKRFSNAP